MLVLCWVFHPNDRFLIDSWIFRCFSGHLKLSVPHVFWGRIFWFSNIFRFCYLFTISKHSFKNNFHFFSCSSDMYNIIWYNHQNSLKYISNSIFIILMGDLPYMEKSKSYSTKSEKALNLSHSVKCMTGSLKHCPQIPFLKTWLLPDRPNILINGIFTLGAIMLRWNTHHKTKLMLEMAKDFFEGV